MSPSNKLPVEIRREEFGSAIATSLVLTLNAELSDRYPEAGANHFRLDAHEVAEDRGAFLVAYHDGMPVGCGALRRLDAETAEVKRMYVTRQVRGRGVARAILSQLEAEAHRLGVRRMVLETGIRQPEAISLYLRTGFGRIQPFGEYTASALTLCMGKTVEIGRPRMTIATTRLVLTPLAADDAPSLLEYRSHPDVRRFQFFEPHRLEDAQQFIAACATDAPVWRQFGIRLRDSAELAGDTGYKQTMDGPRQAEFGITVAPDFQGRGIAREAASAVFDHLFRTSTVHRVFASVDPRNTASLRLLEGLGMRQEAHFRESVWFRGEWADDVIYAILRSEWNRIGT